MVVEAREVLAFRKSKQSSVIDDEDDNGREDESEDEHSGERRVARWLEARGYKTMSRVADLGTAKGVVWWKIRNFLPLLASQGSLNPLRSLPLLR